MLCGNIGRVSGDELCASSGLEAHASVCYRIRRVFLFIIIQCLLTTTKKKN